jgi:predicted ATPase/transcriptional regulator with XRE-family HTH domain
MSATETATFAQMLRHARLSAGLTQEALAERAGLSVRGLSDLERGVKHTPRFDTVALLAQALDLSGDERARFLAAARSHAHHGPALASSAVLERPSLFIPMPLTRLIGREAEVAGVLALLRKGTVRLLTLTGPGGVGKTRLALQVALDLDADVPDGLAFVDLAPLRDAALVPATIARAVGLKEEGAQPLLDTLTAYLRVKRMLLLLDNCEHLPGLAALVAQVLGVCPHLVLLATSRAALHVRGEREIAVPPLALPEDGQRALPDVVLQAAAVQLFVERAQEVKAGFALSETTAPVVAEICQRLGGLPLALELAAAWVKVLTPAALLRRLEQRRLELTGGARDLPARQQTLRSTIEWSYSLLGPQEQVLFRRLAVFVGGWTLEAAEAVCRDVGGGAVDVLGELAALVDKSLIQPGDPRGAQHAAPGTDHGELRFGMLEPLREYALEGLRASTEAALIHEQHAAYYAALAEEAEPYLWNAQQAVWFARLESEHRNLQAALGWYEERGEVARGLRLVGALSWFWMVRGHLFEGRERLAALLALPGTAALPAARAKALETAGTFAFYQRDYAAARSLQEECLAIRRRLGDRAGILSALANLGQTVSQQGDRTAARALYTESLGLSRELGYLPGVCTALHCLGMLAHEQGDHAAARALYEQSLAVSKELGHGNGIAVTLHHLGLLAEDGGEYAEARSLYAQSLGMRREQGDRRGVAQSLLHLGSVAMAQGEYAAAHSLLAESLAVERDLGAKAGIARVLERCGALAAAQEQPERALRLAGAAAALRVAIGAPLPLEGQAQLDARLAGPRHALGEEAAGAAWAAGQAMEVDQAIADALSKG